MAELLCDLDYIKAEYERESELHLSSGDRFRITLRFSGVDTHTFEIGLAEGAQLAAELDVLTSLIRARSLKAQFDRDVTQ